MAETSELKMQPSFLTGYLKGLASRLGGDDESMLLAAADYIRKEKDCDCPNGAELKCINIMCPRK